MMREEIKKRLDRFLPLVVTVGQVAVFPYYIIWLKEISLTYTLFSLLFAGFSFSAALGYRVYQTKKKKYQSYISLVYMGMGMVYLSVYFLNERLEIFPYIALFIQLVLGFLQGYFRAWHLEQKSYKMHAVHHYLLVGVSMLGLSLIKVLSPIGFLSCFGFFILAFGLFRLISGFSVSKSN